MKTYEKYSDKELKVSEPSSKETIYSYDRILNDIRMYEEKLVELNKLKAEADKLNLRR